jgi:lysophospholipase L1-like esterase
LSAAAAAACSSNNTTAPSPTIPPITLMCPAERTVASANGLPVQVTFTAPAASGGTAPLTTTCAPASGVSFPIGSTTVVCNTVDAMQHTGSCNFVVTVLAPARTSVTRYVAFGDSITEGFPHAIVPQLVDPAPDGSYPAVLLALLRARYTAQTIVLFDEGVGGEVVGSGLARLPGVLSADAPGALLLMEGANDLNNFGADGVGLAVAGLREMVRDGRARGIPVLVGTLLPERANGDPPRASHPELVVPLNNSIKAMVASEGVGVYLVDLYAAFGGVADPALIGSDGLHPTAAGNERIAQTFYDAIRARLELPVAGNLPTSR